MRKGLSVLLVLSMIAMLMTCSVAADEASTEPAAPEEEVVITIAWNPVEPEIKAAFDKYYWEPFMESHPGVTIDFQPQNNVWDTVKVQISAGAGPDIFTADGFEISYYAEPGKIVNLQPYADKYNWQDRIYPWALKQSSYKGSIYALPHVLEVSGIHTNEDLLKELGIDKVPTNREEFVDACQKAVDAGKVAIALGNQTRQHNQFPIAHYLNATVGAEGVLALFEGRAKFTDPEYVQAMQLLQDDYDAGFFQNKQTAAVTDDEFREIFRTGGALFEPEGTWLTSELIGPGNWEINWSLNPWPSFNPDLEPSGSSDIGSFFLVNANTKHEELCAELLDSIYADPKWVAEGIGEGGLSPLCTDIDTDALPESTNEDILKNLDAINRIASLPGVSYAPWAVYPPKTNDYLMDNLMRMWTGEFTVQQFCEGAQEVLDAELADGFVFNG